eukprot:7142617-Prymnesium_polylepis.1
MRGPEGRLRLATRLHEMLMTAADAVSILSNLEVWTNHQAQAMREAGYRLQSSIHRRRRTFLRKLQAWVPQAKAALDGIFLVGISTQVPSGASEPMTQPVPMEEPPPADHVHPGFGRSFTLEAAFGTITFDSCPEHPSEHPVHPPAAREQLPEQPPEQPPSTPPIAPEELPNSYQVPVFGQPSPLGTARRASTVLLSTESQAFIPPPVTRGFSRFRENSASWGPDAQFTYSPPHGEIWQR